MRKDQHVFFSHHSGCCSSQLRFFHVVHVTHSPSPPSLLEFFAFLHICLCHICTSDTVACCHSSSSSRRAATLTQIDSGPPPAGFVHTVVKKLLVSFPLKNSFIERCFIKTWRKSVTPSTFSYAFPMANTLNASNASIPTMLCRLWQPGTGHNLNVSMHQITIS